MQKNKNVLNEPNKLLPIYTWRSRIEVNQNVCGTCHNSDNLVGICDYNVASIHARQNVKISRELVANVQVEKICNIVFMLKSFAPPQKSYLCQQVFIIHNCVWLKILTFQLITY